MPNGTTSITQLQPLSKPPPLSHIPCLIHSFPHSVYHHFDLIAACPLALVEN
jgi:hypothetical protein